MFFQLNQSFSSRSWPHSVINLWLFPFSFRFFLYSSKFSDITSTELLSSFSCFSSLICIFLVSCTNLKISVTFSCRLLRQLKSISLHSGDSSPSSKTSQLSVVLVEQPSLIFFSLLLDLNRHWGLSFWNSCKKIFRYSLQRLIKQIWYQKVKKNLSVLQLID